MGCRPTLQNFRPPPSPRSHLFTHHRGLERSIGERA